MYLVTGGAGFIGSHIVEHLVKEGRPVRVLDNFATGKRENIEPFLGDIEMMEGDIRDPETCRRAVKGVSAVMHQAAIPSVPRSVADPFTTMEVGVQGTLTLLLAARDAGVERFVSASSSSVYGDTPTLPKVEAMPTNPLSPYALSKLTGEHLCRLFHQLYGLHTVSLRYFNIFGHRQDPTSQYAAVIPIFITALFRGESPTIFGDGEQSRDFTYVDNVVKANILAATSEKGAGEVMNIACGDRYTLLQLFQFIQEIIGTNLKPLHADPRPGDVKHSLADIDRARELLGYQPGIDLQEGLKKTVPWYQS